MKQYYRDLVEERLKKIFDEQDVQTVLTWLISNDGRLPVVVVGAGFSLNAINRRTGAPVTREEVPLWTDVLRRFSHDLRFDQGGYDALTFAELYREEMGTARFNGTLLSMLRDEELAPGEAHKALFSYPKEAIVTTNQLDTLLDQNGREWQRIVCDPDLALRKRGDGVGIIYFHGHRGDQTSWVFTRSQYEDIHNTRPLLLTKVRQLLSQHPVLIVGYSLSDPDFHHIYRQISLDMAYHHPLGLALFPHGMAPRTAERQHWEKLGIRIATFNRSKPTSESFAKFFEINPDPVAPLENADGIKAWIRKGRDFADCCHRAQDFLTAPERSKTVHFESHAESDIWLEPIRCQFAKNEWDDLPFDEEEIAAKVFNAKPESRTPFRGFKIFDRDRFFSHDLLARQLDAFLSRRRDLHLEVAKWMAFAFDRNLVTERKRVFVGLVSWMWRSLAEDGARPHYVRDEARDVIRRCYAITLKNGYEDEQKRIAEDAAAIGLDVSAVTAAGDRSPAFLERMKKGFENMLDGEFPKARRAYQEAGALAKQVGDAFGEWVAFRGEEDAVWAGSTWEELAKEESRSLTDDYRRRRVAMEQNPKVKGWMDLAHTRREQLAEMTIEGFILENKRRRVSGRSMSFSSYPHEYWTMFRDLETIWAPPKLQQIYLRPLIDLGDFGPDEELRYRLRLGIDKTEKTNDWLERILDARRMPLDRTRERDDGLLKEITQDSTHKLERLRRMEVFPAVADILRVRDFNWVRSFLSQCWNDIQNEQGQNRNHDYDYVRALCSYGELETEPATVLERIEALVSSGKMSSFEARELARGLRNRLSLEQWVGLHDSIAERLVRVVLDLSRIAHKEESFSSDEDLAWALFAIFRGVRRFSRFVNAEVSDEARKWASSLLIPNESKNRQSHQAVYSAATHLAHALAPDDAAREAAVKAVLATIETARSESSDEGFTLGGPMGAWIALIEAGADPTSAHMADAAANLWNKLDATWDETLRIAKDNPHPTWPYIAFLAQWMASGKAAPLPVVRERLLQLVQAAPKHLSLCAEALAPDLWGDLWPSFIDLIWRHSSGGNSLDPVAARLAAVDLFRRWVGPRMKGPAELPPDVGFLIEIALHAIGDESASVANHAAYAIVSYAACARSPADVRRIAVGIRRLATDPRVSIRGAAAYVGKRLPSMAVADEIRTVAIKFDEDLATDPYAVIQRQRVFGALDAEFPPR